MTATFGDRLNASIERTGSLLCIGLDPDIDKFPAHLRALPPGEAIVQFNREIIEQTSDLAAAYKPNFGFYVTWGAEGFEALRETIRLVPDEVPVILDCKVGDIGNTAAAYARGFFDHLEADAVTVSPYLGEDSLEPFLTRPDRGVIILCKTSNPGSGDIQDLPIADTDGPLFLEVARKATDWSGRYPATVGLVVGATWPEHLTQVRAISPTLPILLPGIGAQAGDLRASLQAGLDADGRGLVVTSSRGIIYAGNDEGFGAAARVAAAELAAQISAERAALRPA